MLGIVRYPEQFEFTGSLSIALPNGTVDFSPFPFGSTLNIEDVKLGTINLGTNVRRILSIENRANYVEYVRKYRRAEEFVLFHGGQFSPAKKIFLQAIVSALPENCAFFHWGDIDFGGFHMLSRLRKEILNDVLPWKMGEQELKQYSKYTSGFSENYSKRLTALLEIQELHDCHSCIRAMLESGLRLEQEAMLTLAGIPENFTVKT